MKRINKLHIIGLFSVAAILSVGCKNLPKTPLGEIQNLHVENLSTDRAEIVWDSVKDAGEYQIFIENISSGNYEDYIYTEESRYQLENLDWAETYQITVKAQPWKFDFFRYTDSPQCSITFKTKTPPVPAGEFPRPQILKAVVKDGTVTLNWNSIEGAAFYDIHREYWNVNIPSVWRGKEETKCINASETTFTDTLPDGTTKVLYKVCARNSNFSNTCYWSEKVCLNLN